MQVLDACDLTYCKNISRNVTYNGYSVDLADVRNMMLKQDLKLGDAKTKHYREYFWGGWGQFRVKLVIGHDLVLNPAQHGETVNTFGYSYAQISDKPLNWLDPATFNYTFTYRR